MGQGHPSGEYQAIAHPKTDVVAVLLDPHSTESQNQSRDVQEAAGALGVRVVVLNAGTASEVDTAFATLVQQRVGALLVSGSPTFGSLHKQLVALAARHALPTMYATREYSGAGGLISYGASILILIAKPLSTSAEF